MFKSFLVIQIDYFRAICWELASPSCLNDELFWFCVSSVSMFSNIGQQKKLRHEPLEFGKHFSWRFPPWLELVCCIHYCHFEPGRFQDSRCERSGDPLLGKNGKVLGSAQFNVGDLPNPPDNHSYAKSRCCGGCIEKANAWTHTEHIWLSQSNFQFNSSSNCMYLVF